MKLFPFKPAIIRPICFIGFVHCVIIFLLLLMIVSCAEKKVKQEILVMKDSLLYEINSDEPFTGLHKGKANTSYIEYEVVNGVKQGSFKLYYEDGTIQMIGTMNKNKNVGKWQYFYKDGSIESEGYFVNDYPEGNWIWYYKNGNKSEEGFLRHGVRSGEWNFYSEDGEKDSTMNFAIKDSSYAIIDPTLKVH